MRYARHFYTTRPWPIGQGSQNWSEVAAFLGVRPAGLVRVRQVHGASVLVARDSSGSAMVDADIIVTKARNDLGISVQAADCVPLLLADHRSGAVAAAHAGWRGLAARVPQATVAALDQEFGTRPADLIAAIGPSIGACCYEVGADVRERFEQAGFSADTLTLWFHQAPVRTATNPPMPGLTSHRRPGRWFFDGWSSARDQLIEAGVDPSRIHVAELCTASHPNTLCSYRRDGRHAGRMAGAIRSLTPGP